MCCLHVLRLSESVSQFTLNGYCHNTASVYIFGRNYAHRLINEYLVFGPNYSYSLMQKKCDLFHNFLKR